MLHIDVADNGPGIDEHDRDIIFEKFTRLSNETESGSVGLGLPISAEIMRNLGGSLKHIASDRTGAIFRLELQLSTPGAR